MDKMTFREFLDTCPRYKHWFYILEEKGDKDIMAQGEMGLTHYLKPSAGATKGWVLVYDATTYLTSCNTIFEDKQGYYIKKGSDRAVFKVYLTDFEGYKE